MLLLFIFCVCVGSLDAILYDSFTGKPATRSRIQVYRERNNTQYCLVDVKPCDPKAWRRTDSSCNNLKNPSRGMLRTPTTRVLTPEFSTDYEPRTAADGGPLPLERDIRMEMLIEGRRTDLSITVLLTFYLLAAVNDVNSIHDIVNYVGNTTNCCTPEGKKNYICAPNKIPVHDNVHRYSGIRCQNLTRPQTFQYFGCADFGTTRFARIGFASPIFDLSGAYGPAIGATEKLRAYKNGLLKVEIDNGKIFPPGNPDLEPFRNLCFLNEKDEPRCHLYQTNGVFGANLIALLFFRQHNYIAKKLFEINPCWDDDRIFYTAREINIAIFLQIYFYELSVIMFGRKRMIKDSLITCDGGFRKMYDENIEPTFSDEAIYIQRYYHTIQEGQIKLHDEEGNFLKNFPLVNLTTRTGYFPKGKNMEELLQGSFRTPSGKVDHIVDNDLAERVLGGMQLASDGQMNHIRRGRYFGFPSYVKYREFCTGKKYDNFESLRDVVSEERIYRLKQIYKNVTDVELLPGTWCERSMKGALAPPTLYCLVKEQLLRTIKSDRFWYEDPDRPHAFNEEQLKAVRKATIAGVFCATGEGVTKIQPEAFRTISKKNPLTPCSSPKIGIIDLRPWKDSTCDNA